MTLRRVTGNAMAPKTLKGLDINLRILYNTLVINFPGFVDAKAIFVDRLQFKNWEEYDVTSILSLILSPLLLAVGALIRVPSMHQIDMFENYL